jgi:predicted DNA-binding protein
VWKLDRLGRRTVKLIQLTEKLQEHGIGIKNLTNAIETTTPEGMCIYRISNSFVELERDLARERRPRANQNLHRSVPMHIDIPDDLQKRLRHLAWETGKEFNEFLREAVEARLAVQERAAKNLEGWTQGELRAARDEGIASGPATPLDMDAVIRCARKEWGTIGAGVTVPRLYTPARRRRPG